MVMASTGSMGAEGTVALKTLARNIADKKGDHYSVTIAALRCRLAFCAARAVMVCIRGSRMIRKQPIDMDSVAADLLVKEMALKEM